MSSITPDKYIKFYIEHYEDIASLKELIQRAENSLPGILFQKIGELIEQLAITYFSKLGLEYEEDKNCKYWYHPELHDTVNWIGPYFGFENKGGTPRLFVHICLSKRKSSKSLNHWRSTFNKYRGILAKSNIRICVEPDSEGYYLVERSLEDCVRPELLRAPDEFEKRTKYEIKRFTDILLPILKEGAI